MRQMFGLLTGVAVLIMAGLVFWSLRSKVTIPSEAAAAAAIQPVQTHADTQPKAQTNGMVTLSGPLADYMAQRDGSGSGDSGADLSGTGNEDAHPARPFNPADRVGDSPVGTSTPILKKTFVVAKAVDLPFRIPAHAANPQLRGTYRSYIQRGAARSDDEADVELLLMNEQQYQDLLDGHLGDAQFSAEGSHNQEVNTHIPPTLDQPVKYYLVFRNDSRGPGRVFVQADFRVDY